MINIIDLLIIRYFEISTNLYTNKLSDNNKLKRFVSDDEITCTFA